MKYTTNRRINVRTIRKLTDNQGITLRNGKEVQYKTGWHRSQNPGGSIPNPP